MAISRALLLITLCALAGSFAILIATHDHDAIANLLRRDDLYAIATTIIFLLVAGGLGFALFSQHLARAFKAALLWIPIGVVLFAGYTYRFELRELGERMLGELIPGRAATRGNEVEIVRARGSEFAVGAQVNGAKVSLVLDTGASAVVLTQEAAKAAGLPTAFLNYSVSVETANGRTRAAPVTLERLAVGVITERGVPALIAQPGQLKASLLGMSFLNRLESWQVHGDKLVLRAPH